jgi:hypothetical protein
VDRRLREIFDELGDLWLLGGRTRITVAEPLPGGGTVKTIHRAMTREWARANPAHYGTTMTDIEDLETAGLIEVDWGLANTGGRRGELRLSPTGERLLEARRRPDA